jgi:hypothetical protein
VPVRSVAETCALRCCGALVKTEAQLFTPLMIGLIMTEAAVLLASLGLRGNVTAVECFRSDPLPACSLDRGGDTGRVVIASAVPRAREPVLGAGLVADSDRCVARRARRARRGEVRTVCRDEQALVALRGVRARRRPDLRVLRSAPQDGVDGAAPRDRCAAEVLVHNALNPKSHSTGDARVTPAEFGGSTGPRWRRSIHTSPQADLSSASHAEPSSHAAGCLFLSLVNP